jgi:hypothetical protein
VREGEFATAENSAGVTESVRNLYNKAISGERLSTKARAEILSAARSQLGPYKKRYDETAKTYKGLADSFGVDPNTVVTPLEFPGLSAPPSPMAPPPVAAIPQPAPQTVGPAAAATPNPQPPLEDWNAVFGFPGQ